MAKVLSIETTTQQIALKTPFITSLRRVENVEFVRVTLGSDDGRFAIGEAPATLAITGEDIPIILQSIQSIKEQLIGLSMHDALHQVHASKIGSSAKAALDMALMSFLGFYKLKETTPIYTDITISLNEIDVMFDDAKKALCSGMSILKVKLAQDINHAIKVTKKLAIELPEATLLIDANQAWSLQDALDYVDAVKELDIALIEQPVDAKDVAGLKKITQISTIPILADEAVFSLDDAKRVIESASADMINIKLMKCGGVSKAVEILEYAREKGVKCMLGSMLEGPYSINAALYLAFNYRDVIEFMDLDSPLLYREKSLELEFGFYGNKIVPNPSICLKE